MCRDGNVLRRLAAYTPSLIGDGVYFLALAWAAVQAAGPAEAGLVMAVGAAVARRPGLHTAARTDRPAGALRRAQPARHLGADDAGADPAGRGARLGAGRDRLDRGRVRGGCGEQCARADAGPAVPRAGAVQNLTLVIDSAGSVGIGALALAPDLSSAVALALQRDLAAIGHHRGPSPVDILIALTAQQHRLTVLHVDDDFAEISKVRPGIPMIRLQPRTG
ncbi:hypothetical protein AB0D94_09665 [Streptomyces sp. NPDC048255]|uniref:hypothetical protein n=1 Tax=Streptomyces sp. NPDC048255 TaxID=3154713 RepID=UPI003403AC57